MDPVRPLVVAGADYASSHDAAQDYQIVWAARHGGAFDHMSIALLTRDACGELQVERHNSAPRTWHGQVSCSEPRCSSWFPPFGWPRSPRAERVRGALPLTFGA